MLEGQGGNIAASVGEDGIVIVDDQFAPLAEKNPGRAEGIENYGQARALVINTHFTETTPAERTVHNAGSTLIASR